MDTNGSANVHEENTNEPQMNADGVSFDEVHSYLVSCRFLDELHSRGATCEAILRTFCPPIIAEFLRNELSGSIRVH
jgi:hypothetical protein